MRSIRRGFTLIELLIVVVIIGVLAAVAIPKFQSTKGKANAATLKSDLRNLATAQEAYFSDYATYSGSWANLQTNSNANLSAGNSATVAGVASGYTITVNNTSISTGFTQCTVQVGAGAAQTLDGVIVCS